MKAVIDIGSNSVLLLIGERRADGSVDVSLDRATITRLSEGVGASGRIAPESIERTLACLRDYAGEVAERGVELQVVATEGVRMAANASDFLDPAAVALGRPVEIISGDEEARLSYLSVALEQPDVDAPSRVIDIGGASTELVAGHGTTITERRSHRIGSVRLTEACIRHDPVTPAELAEVEAHARQAFATQPLSPHPELVGLAGTVTTVAALLLDLPAYARDAVDGQRFAREQVWALRDTLARETIEQRAQRPCVSRGRADVIVAGATLLCCALEHCGADTLLVRDRGLRYALL